MRDFDRKFIKALMLVEQERQSDHQQAFEELPDFIQEAISRARNDDSEEVKQDNIISLEMKAAAASADTPEHAWFDDVQRVNGRLSLDLKEHLGGKKLSINIESEDGMPIFPGEVTAGEVSFCICDGGQTLLLAQGELMDEGDFIEGEGRLNPDIEHYGYRILDKLIVEFDI
ncbi:hypothetical protein DI392_17960 [Vibrio albus]|uniref:Uncharacterized protein n=1 Tax=Vibrio albus TaxID=2200953 RepID=A0A2U3B562_9VIBR|nr:hypothetical protein [Vibrio albus]PWI31917.1 hypothetical protein DI392_17960 [Vibrio albus]